MTLAVSAADAASDLRALHPRSSVSRAYYAAFAACHALLSHLRPAVDWPKRDNFRHAELPGELRWTLLHYLQNRVTSFQADVYRKSLETAYDLRRFGDYKPELKVTPDHAQTALESAFSLLRLAKEVVR